MKQNKINLTVYFVDFLTPVLSEILICSFEKFKKENFNIKYLIVENSEFNLKEHLSNLFPESIEISVINNPVISKFSHAHGEGLEKGKDKIDTEYVFTCHSDTCVVSSAFFDEIERLINEDFDLAGVCQDSHPDRVSALHCSGLLCKTDIFKSISLLPELPKIDTADKLTLHVRSNGLKEYLFKNTYNDKTLCDHINQPYKDMGKNCGVDRCINDNNEVIFIHQGRGTTKHSGQYNTPGKILTKQWIQICKFILQI